MCKFILLVCLLATLPTLSKPATAQETKTAAPEPRPEAHYYHLDFVVKELSEDGKVVNNRDYKADMSTDSNASIRTGSRIPIHVTTNTGDVQYLDIGVNIDCDRARETAQGLAVRISAEISSLATPSNVGEPTTPIIRQNKWVSFTVLPEGKHVTAFTSDNLESRGKMQLEITATRIQ